MADAELESSWARCWQGLQAQGDGSMLMQQILLAYQEPQRKYHTVQHLSECLALLGRHAHLAMEPAEVEMALWFHDAIYQLTAADNEQRSADWAVRALSGAGVAAERVERIRQHILATRHAALPQGRDQQLLVDVDLAILGASPARFEEYEAQIQEEYAWVPQPLFRQKRAQVLSEFLARQPIYTTPQLREALEPAARANLACAIERLRGGAAAAIGGGALGL